MTELETTSLFCLTCGKRISTGEYFVGYGLCLECEHDETPTRPDTPQAKAEN